MTTLANVSQQLVAVTDAGQRVEIRPGATVEVDGRQHWKDDLFVKAGWLTLSEPEPVEPVKAQETPKPTRRKR